MAAQNELAPIKPEKGGVAIPAVLWLAGVPFIVVLLLWALFFRG